MNMEIKLKPDNLTFVIDGVRVEIDMAEFTVGTSVFIPCVRPNKALKTVQTACNRKGISHTLTTTIERDMLGVRLWRTA